MNPIAKEKFNKIINHNVILSAMIIVCCLQIYNYIRLNKVSCIFVFIAIFVLAYQGVSKNITISLFIAIFVSNLLLGCAKILEGHTVMVHTPYQHTHGDPTDTKMIPGFDENTTEGGVAQPGNDPKLNPGNLDNEVPPGPARAARAGARRASSAPNPEQEEAAQKVQVDEAATGMPEEVRNMMMMDSEVPEEVREAADFVGAGANAGSATRSADAINYNDKISNPDEKFKEVAVIAESFQNNLPGSANWPLMDKFGFRY